MQDVKQALRMKLKQVGKDQFLDALEAFNADVQSEGSYRQNPRKTALIKLAQQVVDQEDRKVRQARQAVLKQKAQKQARAKAAIQAQKAQQAAKRAQLQEYFRMKDQAQPQQDGLSLADQLAALGIKSRSGSTSSGYDSQQIGGASKLAGKKVGDVVYRMINGKRVKYMVVKASAKQAKIFGPMVLRRVAKKN